MIKATLQFSLWRTQMFVSPDNSNLSFTVVDRLSNRNIRRVQELFIQPFDVHSSGYYFLPMRNTHPPDPSPPSRVTYEWPPHVPVRARPVCYALSIRITLSTCSRHCQHFRDSRRLNCSVEAFLTAPSCDWIYSVRPANVRVVSLTFFSFSVLTVCVILRRIDHSHQPSIIINHSSDVLPGQPDLSFSSVPLRSSVFFSTCGRLCLRMINIIFFRHYVKPTGCHCPNITS